MISCFTSHFSPTLHIIFICQFPFLTGIPFQFRSFTVLKVTPLYKKQSRMAELLAQKKHRPLWCQSHHPTSWLSPENSHQSTSPACRTWRRRSLPYERKWKAEASANALLFVWLSKTNSKDWIETGLISGMPHEKAHLGFERAYATMA